MMINAPKNERGIERSAKKLAPLLAHRARAMDLYTAFDDKAGAVKALYDMPDPYIDELASWAIITANRESRD